MQQLVSAWTSLPLRRQVIVALATGAMFFAILAMSRMATSPNMTLLYAGLENGAAGEVVRALEQRGAAFEVRGGSIFVDSSQRDELRMTLASEGLPANGARGYELLDALTGFGYGDSTGYIYLLPGDYTVVFLTPAGYAPSPADQGGDDTVDSDGTSVPVTLTAGQDDTTIDSGFVERRAMIAKQNNVTGTSTSMAALIVIPMLATSSIRQSA